MKKLAFGLLAAIALALPAYADGMKVGDISIDDVWSRATAPRAPAGAVYMVLSNTGAEMDRLVAAAAPIAEKVELHTHSMVDGVMKMRQVEAIEVAPGEPSVLQPGGLHVMLIGLKQPLNEGEMVPVTLTFEKAGDVEIMSHVQAAGAMEAGHDHGHGGHDHGAPKTN